MKRIHESELVVGQHEAGALFVGATVGRFFMKAFNFDGFLGFDVSASMEWSDRLFDDVQVHAEDAL